nr:MAG TPA: Structural Protein [Caudoviricetes sp.]
MSINSIYSSTPQYYLNGIKDESTKPPIQELERLPQHLPLFYVVAEQGDLNANIMSLGAAKQHYGENTFEYTSKYCTHATPFINGIGSTDGSLMMIKRVIPYDQRTGEPKARKAWIRFSVGVTKQEMTTRTKVEGSADKYEDRPNGIQGHALRWTTSSVTFDEHVRSSLSTKDQQRFDRLVKFGGGLNANEFYQDGVINPLATGISVQGANQELVIPIFDLEVSHYGEYGNNLGIRLSAPNSTSNSKPDVRFFENTLARPFRIEMIKRKNRRSMPTIVNNLNGETFVDFTFKPDTVNPFAGNVDTYLGTMLLDAYRNLDTTGGRNVRYGNFNNIHVYEDNVEYLLKMLYEREKDQDEKAVEAAKLEAKRIAEELAANRTVGPQDLSVTQNPRRLSASKETDLDEEYTKPWYQIDFLTGLAMNGLPYRTIEVKSLLTGGKEMKASTDHWATGGDDGLSGYTFADGTPKTTNDIYNELVDIELNRFSDEANEYLDLPRYPFSVFYDSGYPVNMKESLFKLTQFRKDVSVCVSTLEVPEGQKGQKGVQQLSRTVEAGRVAQLSEKARSYPESDVFGTGACRANLILDGGYIIGSTYRGIVPMTYELALKRARFMGQPNGVMRTGYGYDQDGIKQIQYVKHLSNPFMPYVTREKNWTNGATWAQFYDRNTLFFPAVRTIYKDETSVLMSDINMLIATDLQKVCFRAWRRLTGDSKMTPAQLQELSNRYILEDVDGRYDGRVIIRPETYFTPADKNRGYSWRCDIHMYANNMKTVGVYGVIVHRQEDLEA